MRFNQEFILIKGAGDLASGIAVRLRRSGFRVVMTEIAAPTTVRRTVAFSRAVTEGAAQVEEIHARLAPDADAVYDITSRGEAAVIIDRAGESVNRIKPFAVVDAIIAKRNIATRLGEAPAVIGVGPGFTAGVDCNAVIETQRGHTLGRAYYADSDCRTALANTGIPGSIAGYTTERLLRAPADGNWTALRDIGAQVKADELVAEVKTIAGSIFPVYAAITGIIRGMLPSGFLVQTGMKCGDIDPRCNMRHCYTVSDKALAVAGGVLEAILRFSQY